MASTTRKKRPCSKCDKAAGIFTCSGCQKDFCYRHVAEHRQELNKQMDELTTDHDQFQQIIAEQESQPNCHPLIQKINKWEQESINKVHQAAEDARKQLLTILATHRSKVTNDLTHLIEELSKARNEDDYVETDLKEWMERLNKLQKDLNAAQTIDFDTDNSSSSLISKIYIHGILTDFFSRTIGDIQIIEDGRVIVHGQTNRNAAACGRDEYSWGQHRLRFKLEQLRRNGNFSCGILSKTAQLESLLYISTNNNIYSYDYNSDEAYTIRNENGLLYFTGLNYGYLQNDIVELLIDCDQKMICLTNQRTHLKQELHVNLNKCPFPWQFFVTLSYANSRISICDENLSIKTDRKN
ncbi:unnamed protein product [Rotaria sordida]|uniref:B box-type domain-containing protein n=1 Tax=Rotaria sordida TaxID=392033 RepID=A0A813ZQ27_9BILA|nr:unnamed protein product [Rotaria sordida]CAF3915253.1 unnamed protein product [Rotaria sordida]